MTTPQDIAATLQPRAAALLQGDPEALLQAELEVSDTGFAGLAVIAPAAVAADGAVPVVVVVQKSSLRGWEVTEEANLVLVAYEPATGNLRAAPVLVDRKAREYPAPGLKRPPRPPASDRDTLMTKAYRLNARELLDLPSRPGRWVVRAMAFDWMSNGAAIDFGTAAERPAAAPAVEPLPAADRGRLPSYESSARHPPLPGQGIATRIEPLRNGGHALLGSFGVRATAPMLLPQSQSLPTAGGPRQAVAVMPLGLLAATLDGGRPSVARLGVPVWGETVSVPGQRLEGRFALDLGAFGITQRPGRHAIYLFADDEVQGPLTLNIDTPTR